MRIRFFLENVLHLTEVQSILMLYPSQYIIAILLQREDYESRGR